MDMAYATTEAEEPAQTAYGLSVALRNNDKALCELWGAMSLIEERMALVLKPEPSADESDRLAAAREPRSDAVMTVEDLTCRLAFAAQRLLGLAARIDL